jgi:hypothetical protein
MPKLTAIVTSDEAAEGKEIARVTFEPTTRDSLWDLPPGTMPGGKGAGSGAATADTGEKGTRSNDDALDSALARLRSGVEQPSDGLTAAERGAIGDHVRPCWTFRPWACSISTACRPC